jgi:hypothetical protein
MKPFHRRASAAAQCAALITPYENACGVWVDTVIEFKCNAGLGRMVFLILG